MPLNFVKKSPAGEPKRLLSLGQELVAYRVQKATWSLRATCAFIAAVQFDGFLEGDCIRCPIGWKYAPDGECRGNPRQSVTQHPQESACGFYPTVDK